MPADFTQFITTNLYYIVSAVLSLGVLIGISMMSKVKTARLGNGLSALCMLVAIAVVFVHYKIVPVYLVWVGLGIGLLIGIILTIRVDMISMPQTVALLNGLGGAASAVVGLLTLLSKGVGGGRFELITAAIAVVVGSVTFSGSLIAAGKLHRVLKQQPVVLPLHQLWTMLCLLLSIAFIAFFAFAPQKYLESYLIIAFITGTAISLIFGIVFAIRVGGADMPITISLLNSTSGVAASIAGMATGDILTVSVGGIVGASGLLLTQIMCRAMNRSLANILFSKAPKKTVAPASVPKASSSSAGSKEGSSGTIAEAKSTQDKVGTWLKDAKDVIIVPGYGMAVSQAQSRVKMLADKMEEMGKNVRFAIHPVAGRMPGHMNVLLCEVDIPYEKLYEMEAINGDFEKTDLVIIIGASDVVNPAANTAEGTPIYGMPILEAGKAKHIIICNFDLKPGYAGVPNPLYEMKDKTELLLGDAKPSIDTLLSKLQGASEAGSSGGDSSVGGGAGGSSSDMANWLKEAKNVIIVPGYGMAVSQAQSRVKMLADKMEEMGKNVRFAIHPVAGRMPGHMNVLLCEVDIPYEKLYEMETINGDFEKTDLVIIIGASDVVNPAANTAEGTPIYGMPILEAGKAKHIIICNFDLKPGYAGVPNPLYEMKDKTELLLGDAKPSIDTLLSKLQGATGEGSSGADSSVGGGASASSDMANWLKEAKDVIIVPGYGMAVSQAQSRVKMLADKMEEMGKNVRFAIHPVAGRMPGHMNVLLCEVDIPYEKLYEMEAINGDFEKTDLVIIIGASDVVNPAANTAEGTPIYGMPILEAGKAKHIIICNFDLKPGYAGVPNPLYEMKEKVSLLLGDAKPSVDTLLSKL